MKTQAEIILIKENKKLFLNTVKLATKHLSIISIPTVNFKYCNEAPVNSISHIHIDTNTICISEYRLSSMTHEEIYDTAFYMVNHLVESVHGDKFDTINENNKSNYFNKIIPELNNIPIEEENEINYKNKLQELQSEYRILISELDNAIDFGYMIKRKEILKEIFYNRKKIKEIENYILDLESSTIININQLYKNIPRYNIIIVKTIRHDIDVSDLTEDEVKEMNLGDLSLVSKTMSELNNT